MADQLGANPGMGMPGPMFGGAGRPKSRLRTEHQAQLSVIVQKMESHGASPEEVDAIVTDFTRKYEPKEISQAELRDIRDKADLEGNARAGEEIIKASPLIALGMASGGSGLLGTAARAALSPPGMGVIAGGTTLAKTGDPVKAISAGATAAASQYGLMKIIPFVSPALAARFSHWLGRAAKAEGAAAPAVAETVAATQVPTRMSSSTAVFDPKLATMGTPKLSVPSAAEAKAAAQEMVQAFEAAAPAEQAALLKAAGGPAGAKEIARVAQAEVSELEKQAATAGANEARKILKEYANTYGTSRKAFEDHLLKSTGKTIDEVKKIATAGVEIPGAFLESTKAAKASTRKFTVGGAATPRTLRGYGEKE